MGSLDRERVPSPRPIAAREIPLIDRVEEMNVLKEAVYRAVNGEGSLVFIHGEAGIARAQSSLTQWLDNVDFSIAVYLLSKYNHLSFHLGKFSGRFMIKSGNK